MASFTPYLDLLKKSPITDGDDPFNVDTMLNENWDKIDEKVRTKEDSFGKYDTLSDITKELLDLKSDSVPDDAFAKLALGTGKYGYRVVVKTFSGVPVSGVTVNGISMITGGNCVTDETGATIGVSTSKNPTLSVTSPFINLKNTSQQVQWGKVITDIELVLEKTEEDETIVTTSSIVCFSPEVSNYDTCCIGGGGDGYVIPTSLANRYRGGGHAGEVINQFGIENTSSKMSVIVGSNGIMGGDTTIEELSIIAKGGGVIFGEVASTPAVESVTNGGRGASPEQNFTPSNGGDRSVFPFNDASILSGGGGGRGSLFSTNPTGGSGGESGGGKGGDYNQSGYSRGEDGKYWGSGGGTLGGNSSDRNDSSFCGKGKQGCAMFRWRYTE